MTLVDVQDQGKSGSSDSFPFGTSSSSIWSIPSIKSFVYAQYGKESTDDNSNNKCNFVNLDQSLEEKRQDILDCLNGTDDRVDLWRLRDLCLTRGGLVCAQIRKQAWPKLFGTLENLISKNNDEGKDEGTINGSIRPSQNDIKNIIKDTACSIWDIEDHIAISRQDETATDFEHKKVTKLTGLQQLSTRLPTIKSVDTALDFDSCTSGGTFSSDSIQGSPPIIHTTRALRKSSKQECQVLNGILLSILKKVPKESPFFEDDRYHYYHGMSDLTALVLINLQSPSLTYLMLEKLAEHHLRDAMRSDAKWIVSILRLSLFPLLRKADKELHQHITCCMDIPHFAVTWVQTWFSQQLVEVQVASRVLDFFLVSHPMMPIYFTVAFLSHEFNRTKILKTDRSESQIHLVLRSLPLQLIEQDSCSLHTELLQETIEEVLEHSLRLIQTVPPYRLLEVATQHGQLRNNLPSITMFQRDVPSWGKKNFALTDWALLKQAKELRVGRTPPKISPRNVGSMALYPRAMVALGMDPPTKDRTGHQNCYKRNLLVTLVFGLIASVLFVRSFKSIQPNLFLKIEHLPTIDVEQNHFSNEPFKKIYHRRMKRQQSISHRPRVYKRNTKPLPFTKCSATSTWYEARPLQNTSTHNFNEETESEKMENNVVFEDVERNYATGSQVGLVRTVEKRFKVIPILRLGPIIKSLRKRIDNMTRGVACVLMEASIFLIVD